MTHPERKTDPLADLLRNASELSDSEKLRARESFLKRVDEEGPQRSAHSRRNWIMPLAIAAAALLTVYLGWPSSDLSYEVKGAVSDGGYIRAAKTQSVSIAFSDETRIIAEPEARLRIVDVREHGARISVEEGKLQVHVTHEEQTAWQFVAGPFQVKVTGTRFDLIWDSELEQLKVILHEGSVNVDGYSGSGPVEVRAGQSFLGDARSRTMQVRDSTTELSELEPNRLIPAPQQPKEQVVSKPSLEAPSKTESRSHPQSNLELTPKESWATLVSQGEFKKVVARAEDQGIASCMATCSAQNLSALADAARYTGQSELAEKSLLSLRSRFAASSGNRAAFLLGRLYEGQGKTNKALGWYDTALTHSPSGPFSSESLAGKMRMTSAVQGKSAAAAIAREYLRRYPTGVHASAARQLAQTP